MGSAMTALLFGAAATLLVIGAVLIRSDRQWRRSRPSLGSRPAADRRLDWIDEIEAWLRVRDRD